MKASLGFIAALVLSQSLSAQQLPLQTVKVADGTSATCKTQLDVNGRRNRLGAYRAQAKSAELVDGKVKVGLTLQFLKCENLRGTYGFAAVSPYKTTVFSNPLLEDREHKSQVTVSDVRLKGYKDGVYKVLVNSRIPDDEKGIQTLTIEVPAEELINDSQRNLEGKFNANLDLWLSKQVRFESLSDASKSFDDNVNYGSFRVHLNVESDGTSITKATLK